MACFPGKDGTLPMATGYGIGLRWSSGALSVALHAVILFLLLWLGTLAVPDRQARPPLVATFVPLPEPEPPEPDTYDVDATIRRDSAGGRPSPAPGAVSPPVDRQAASELPAMSLFPDSRDAAPSGGGGGASATAGDGGAGTGGSGGGEGAGDGGGTNFARPEWIERLTQAQMRPYYPPFAVQSRTDGSAALACQVDARNRVRHCYILGETPANIGFGRAALRMSHLFRIRPPQRDGAPQYEAWVRVRIDFQYR
jgi:protein TonB